MKTAHGLLTNHMTFFIAIHFLTKREREQIENDMGERVKELSEDYSNPMAEELEEGQISEGKKEAGKEVDENVSSVKTDEFIELETFQEDEDLHCSFDGVQIAKHTALKNFAKTFFINESVSKTPKLSDREKIKADWNAKFNSLNSNPTKGKGEEKVDKLNIAGINHNVEEHKSSVTSEVLEDIDMFEEDEDLHCSFDGVKIAKKKALTIFKDNFFSTQSINKTSTNAVSRVIENKPTELKLLEKLSKKTKPTFSVEALVVQDDDIQCSYDGVKNVREKKLEAFKNTLFNDAPISKDPRTVVKMYENNNLKSKIKREKLTIKSKFCELCDKRFNGFTWRQDYKKHMERKHSEIGSASAGEPVLITTPLKQEKLQEMEEDGQEQGLVDPLAGQEDNPEVLIGDILGKEAEKMEVQEEVQISQQEEVQISQQEEVRIHQQEEVQISQQDGGHMTMQKEIETTLQEEVQTTLQEESPMTLQEEVKTVLQEEEEVQEVLWKTLQAEAHTFLKVDGQEIMQEKVQPTRQKMVETLLQEEVQIVYSLQEEVQTTRQEKVQTTLHEELVTDMQKGEANTLWGKVQTTAPVEEQAALQKEVQTTLYGNLQAVLQEEVQVVLQEEVQTFLQEEVQAVLQEEVQTVLQEEVQAVLQEEVQAVLQEEVQAVLQEEIQTVLQEEVQAVLQEEVQSALQEGVQTTCEDINQEKVPGISPIAGLIFSTLKFD